VAKLTELGLMEKAEQDKVELEKKIQARGMRSMKLIKFLFRKILTLHSKKLRQVGKTLIHFQN